MYHGIIARTAFYTTSGATINAKDTFSNGYNSSDSKAYIYKNNVAQGTNTTTFASTPSIPSGTCYIGTDFNLTTFLQSNLSVLAVFDNWSTSIGTTMETVKFT